MHFCIKLKKPSWGKKKKFKAFLYKAEKQAIHNRRCVFIDCLESQLGVKKKEFKAFLYKAEKQAVHVMPMCFYFLVTFKYKCVIDS